MTRERGWRPHARSISWRPSAPRRCQKPSDGAAIACRALVAEDEAQPHAGDFDEITVVQAHGAGDGIVIDVVLLCAGAKAVAVSRLLVLILLLSPQPTPR